MRSAQPPGLFITGTDTGVGKTYVGCCIARNLRAAGCRVGVYKPAASGCPREGGRLVSTDAVDLWQAAGQPGDLELVCPQCFEAPLAPHLAARAEGRELDERLLRSGLDAWRGRCDVLLVEGAGGLMSPLGDELYVADLALEFGFPLVVVAPNTLGVINQTLQTLITAATFGEGLPIAGIVLNDQGRTAEQDPSIRSNAEELAARCVPPLLARLAWNAPTFDRPVDWLRLGLAVRGSPTPLAVRGSPDPAPLLDR